MAEPVRRRERAATTHLDLTIRPSRPRPGTTVEDTGQTGRTAAPSRSRTPRIPSRITRKSRSVDQGSGMPHCPTSAIVGDPLDQRATAVPHVVRVLDSGQAARLGPGFRAAAGRFQPLVRAGPERGDAAVPGRTHGRNRLVRANPTHPATAALTQLLELSFGPQIVIGEEFALPQVEQVVIFGSWADRHHGSPGPPPTTSTSLSSAPPSVPRSTTPPTGHRYASASRSTRTRRFTQVGLRVRAGLIGYTRPRLA